MGFGAVGVGLLVAERHRAQAQEAVTGVAHSVDIFLVAPRRRYGPKLSVTVNEHHRCCTAACSHASDSRDVRCRLSAGGADVNNPGLSRDSQVVDILSLSSPLKAEPAENPMAVLWEPVILARLSYLRLVT